MERPRPRTSGHTQFTATLTDNILAQIQKTFQLPVVAAQPLLQVSPLSLNFSGVTGGDAPPTQALSIALATATSSTFTVLTDGGQPNTQCSVHDNRQAGYRNRARAASGERRSKRSSGHQHFGPDSDFGSEQQRDRCSGQLDLDRSESTATGGSFHSALRLARADARNFGTGSGHHQHWRSAGRVQRDGPEWQLVDFRLYSGLRPD